MTADQIIPKAQLLASDFQNVIQLAFVGYNYMERLRRRTLRPFSSNGSRIAKAVLSPLQEYFRTVCIS